MRTLTIQDYEAIAAYDHEKNSSFSAALLIEPENNAVALFTFDGKGVPMLKSGGIPEGAYPEFSAFEGWEEYTEQIKAAIRRYYKFNRETDFEVEGMNSTAAHLMEEYQKIAGQALNDAFQSADKELEFAGIDQGSLRILLIGSMAKFFPAEVVARLHYSAAMPVVMDVRYASYSELSNIIAEGLDICARNRALLMVGPIEWKVLQADGDITSENTIVLAEDGADAADFEKVSYGDSDGVLISVEEPISLSVAGEPQQIYISHSLIPGVGLINVGLQYKDENFYIVLQNCESKQTEIRPISIRFKGE